MRYDLPDLSIIIVSWNVADLLKACLTSIYRADHPFTFEILVVDSASSDHSVEMVRREFPQVKLIAETTNLGFSRCNNIGLEAAQGRYRLLLNPDTEVLDDALERLISYLDSHPDVGVIGPHTLNTDGSTQSTRRRFPTAGVLFTESTWLQALAPRRWLDDYYVVEQPDSGIFDVDWVQGSALLLRREVYEQIGGLDEGFVMYSEEMDWCKRARLAGWHVVYHGEAHIVHHGGKSSEQVTGRKHIHFQESKLRYVRKYHGNVLAQALRIWLLLLYLWQLTLEGLKSLVGNKRAMRQERIRAYWQVLRSGLKVMICVLHW